jgi:hypothetical protein
MRLFNCVSSPVRRDLGFIAKSESCVKKLLSDNNLAAFIVSPALGRTLMSSYRYRFVGYEKLPSGLNADDVQLHCRLPDRLVKEIRDSNYAKRYYLGLTVQLSFLA